MKNTLRELIYQIDMTLFETLKFSLNNNVGGSVEFMKILNDLHKFGFIVKNPDGSFYDYSTRQYLSKLKRAGYITYDRKVEIIYPIKMIPENIKPKDI